ncbi:MAG: hypothetical protein M3R52_10665 [Acidobacteriota bacterium]|nr:hypothetical protein [Acidobacteriota bacterium]
MARVSHQEKYQGRPPRSRRLGNGIRCRGFHPQTGTLVHYEPSIHALSWEASEARYKKKFDLVRKYMFTALFAWLPPSTHLEQIAIFYNHLRGRDTIAGAKIMSIDELAAEIRAKVTAYARGPQPGNPAGSVDSITGTAGDSPQ